MRGRVGLGENEGLWGYILKRWLGLKKARMLMGRSCEEGMKAEEGGITKFLEKAGRGTVPRRSEGRIGERTGYNF